MLWLFCLTCPLSVYRPNNGAFAFWLCSTFGVPHGPRHIYSIQGQIGLEGASLCRTVRGDFRTPKCLYLTERMTANLAAMSVIEPLSMIVRCCLQGLLAYEKLPICFFNDISWRVLFVVQGYYSTCDKFHMASEIWRIQEGRLASVSGSTIGKLLLLSSF